MKRVIRVVGLAYGGPCEFAGQYLKWYDPNIPDPEDVMATFTNDIAKAKIFPDITSAMAEWQRVRQPDPVRPDGKPNRPLTALTIVVEPATAVEP